MSHNITIHGVPEKLPFSISILIYLPENSQGKFFLGRPLYKPITSPCSSLCSRSLLCFSPKATESLTFSSVFSSCFLLETRPFFICLNFPRTPRCPNRLAQYCPHRYSLMLPSCWLSSQREPDRPLRLFSMVQLPPLIRVKYDPARRSLQCEVLSIQLQLRMFQRLGVQMNYAAIHRSRYFKHL